MFRATIKAVKTNEWCNLKLFWYLYCYNWTNFTLFFSSSSSSSSSQICIFDFEYKIANEIKRTMAKSYFYTNTESTDGVVFEIATSRHRKFSVKKRVCNFIKKRLQHKYFLWNLRNIYEHLFWILKNICKWRFLNSFSEYSRYSRENMWHEVIFIPIDDINAFL